MAKNLNIKKAHTTQDLTMEQIQEIDRCMYGYDNPETGKHECGPVYFAKTYVRIQHPKKGDLPFLLYSYQEKMMEMYLNNNKVVVLSARQTGKEEKHSALIATPTGWTTMGEIQPGDIVLTPDGKTSTVLQKHPQGIKPDYRITFDDGSTANCGLEHLWKCFIRNKWDKDASNGNGGLVVNEQIRTTAELIEIFNKNKTRKNSSNYNIRIPVVERVNFNERNLPLDPYMLGALLGDGCISNRYTVLFTNIDAQIIKYVKEECIEHDCDLLLKASPSANGIDYRVKGKNGINKVNKIIRELNLSGTVSDTKFIPEEYLLSSHEQRLALLQGLMDTDGTVLKRGTKTTITYCTTSERLRDGVQQLVWSLGGKCSYSVRLPQNNDHKIAYDLYVSLPNPKDCFRLIRKKDLCQDVWGGGNRAETMIRRTIVDIKLVGKEESSCISIDHPEHLYITDNFTVTHNSITSAIFLLWFAMFIPDKTVLIAANKNDNAIEMISRIQYAYEFIPMWLKPGVTDDGWNKHSLKFDNKSRIVSAATSGNSGRGMSISLLFLDEFAFVAPNIQEEFWTSILPTLSTGGACIMSSTPNGAVDKFASIWRAANLENNTDGLIFKPIHVAWDEPPGRTEQFKKDHIIMLGDLKWKQEYECEFLSSDPLLIDSMVIGQLEQLICQPIREDMGFKFWKPLQPNKTYLVGVDPATGSNNDFSTILVYDFQDLSMVAEWRSNTMSSPKLYAALKLILKQIESHKSMAYFSVENNGVGEGVIALYENDEKLPEQCEFVSEEGGNRLGMRTETRVKLRTCMVMKQMVESGKIEIKSEMLLKEIKSYVSTRGSYAAQLGATDDLISALLIVLRLLAEMATYEQRAHELMNQYDDIGSFSSEDTEGVYDDDNFVPDGFVF